MKDVRPVRKKREKTTVKTPEPKNVDKTSASAKIGTKENKPKKKVSIAINKSPTDVKMYISGNDKQYKGKAFYAPRKMITKGHEMIPWHKIYINTNPACNKQSY